MTTEQHTNDKTTAAPTNWNAATATTAPTNVGELTNFAIMRHTGDEQDINMKISLGDFTIFGAFDARFTN